MSIHEAPEALHDHYSYMYMYMYVCKLTSNTYLHTHAFFCDVRMFLRATSAMMDVPTDEQELPEPVKLRVLCEVSDEWEKLGRIRHQRTT